MRSKWIAALRWLVLAALWPASCWATAITLHESMKAVPLLAWLMVFILSTVSGMAALLSRLRAEPPANLTVFVAAHMLGSWLAGLVAFFLAEYAEQGDFLEATTIALAAYAGAKLMDKLSDRFVERASA